MLFLKCNRLVKLNQAEPITKLGSDTKTAHAVYGVIGEKSLLTLIEQNVISKASY